jgi:serine/threonine protein kinase
MSSVQAFLDKFVTPSSVPEKLILQFAKQILQGLHHVHTSNVIHRDLKPLNMLLVSAQHGVNDQVKTGIGNCPFLLQLADFGNAGLVSDEQTGRRGGFDFCDNDNDSPLNYTCV